MVTHSLYRQLGSPESDRDLLARFVSANDQDAFAVLVDRHGPLVRGICRRMLRDAHAADDAVQATFLLLARKAGSLANADAVGSWLFGVARRVSLAARRVAQRVGLPLTPDIDTPTPEPRSDWDDLLGVLEDELARLPERLRAPLVACFLQGQTQDEAARALGWSVSTLRRRLDEGRELLRARLGTRGTGLPASLFAGAMLPNVVSTLPATLRAALLTLVAGGPVAPPIAVLVAALTATSWLIKGTLVLAGLTLLAGLVYAASFLSTSNPEPPPRPLPRPAPQPLARAWVEPLPPGALARFGTTAFRHGTTGPAGVVDASGVDQVQFQADGTLVSAGGEQVRFWNPDTGEELHRAAPLATRLHMTFFAPMYDEAGRYALPDANDQGECQPSVTLWDLHARRALPRVNFGKHPEMKAPFTGLSSVAAGAQAFARLDFNGDAWIWNADGSPRSRLDAKFQPGGLLALLPDGVTAVTVEAGQVIRTWDTKANKPTTTFGGDLPDALTSVVSPDGRWLVTLADCVRLWDLAERKLVGKLAWPGLPEQPALPARLGISADGSLLVGVALSEDGDLAACRWQLPAGEPFAWHAPSRGIAPVRLAVDARRNRLALAGGMGAGTVRLFDTTTGREFVPADAHAAAIHGLSFTPDGTALLSTDVSGELRLWNLKGRMLNVEQGKRPERPEPVVAVEARRVTLHRGTPQEVQHNLSVFELLGARPALAAPGLERWPANAPHFVFKGAELSPDGNLLAVAFATPPARNELGRVALLDLARRKVVWQAALPESAPARLHFSTDSRTLAVGTTRVRLFDVATGTQREFVGHRGAVTALTFHPDGRRLASGSTDSTILLWDLARQER